MDDLPPLNAHLKLIADAAFSGVEAEAFPKEIRRALGIANEACYNDHDLLPVFGRRVMFNLPAALVEDALFKLAPRFGFKPKIAINKSESWPYLILSKTVEVVLSGKRQKKTLEFTISKTSSTDEIVRPSKFRVNRSKDGQLDLFDPQALLSRVPKKVFGILVFCASDIDLARVGSIRLEFPDEEMKKYHYGMDLDARATQLGLDPYTKNLNLIRVPHVSLRTLVERMNRAE